MARGSDDASASSDEAEDEALTGDGFGALRFRSLGKLLGSQRTAAEAIIRGIHRIAAAATARDRRDLRARYPDERPGAPPSDDARYFERPHHSFVVDGERGSGKTTVLLTLYAFIKAMRLDTRTCEVSGEPDDEIKAGLEGLRLTPPSRDGTLRTALLLPIVFPETMEEGETTMEAVFAHMDRALEAETALLGQGAERRVRLERLRDDLRLKVGKAWMFSQRIGERALANDAIDYTDFVVRRAEHNRLSYTRIDLWRDFVDAFLDEMRCALLILAFDDSDLNPDSSDDVLRSIRVYCSHPRVVTLMAVEMSTLQDALLTRGLLKRAPGLQGLDYSRASRIAEGEQANVGALVDKVLPPALRFRLDTAADQVDIIFKPGLSAYADRRSRAARSAGDLRQAFAWWLLDRAYRPLLHDTMRRLSSFRALVARPGHVDVVQDVMRYAKLDALRRAAGPALEGLARVVGDGTVADPRIDPEAASTLNDLERLAVDFGIDLEIAVRGLDVARQGWIAVWLVGEGDDEDEDRASFSDDGFGLASVLAPGSAPRNCTYVHQYRRLQRRKGDRNGAEPFTWLSHMTAVSAGHAYPFPEFSRSLARLADYLSFDDEEALSGLALHFDRLRNQWERHQRILPGQRLTGLSGADVEAAVTFLHVAARGDVSSRPELGHLLLQGDGRGDLGSEDRKEFTRGLLRSVRRADEEWVQAARTWSDALVVAGEEDLGGTDLRPPRHAAGVELLTFPDLVDRTGALEHADDRTKALLGWTIAPLLQTFFDHSCNLSSQQVRTEEAWAILRRLMRGFVGAARRLERAPPDEAALDLDRSVRKSVFVDLRRHWEGLSARLDGGQIPAGSRLPTEWPRGPGSLLALLLGASEAWVEANLGVRA